jgi:hypothetical protein
MWYPAEISLSSYMPSELEAGMLFINRISVGVVEPYIELFELEEVPEDADAFMAKNGAPVELVIIDSEGQLLATHDQIGWWDDGDDTDDYREVTLEDINYLLKELDGYVDIDIEEDYGLVIYDGKVILTLAPEEDDEDWDVTLNDGLEEI